jgi:translation initiation factor IF-1
LTIKISKMSRFHFDINGTIIGTDSTDKASLDEAVCECICRNTPYTDYDSYYSYLKETFPTSYKEKCYQTSCDTEEKQQLHAQLKHAFERGLFDSFLKVLELYPNNEFVLRTFGHDGPKVLSQLSEEDRKRVTLVQDDYVKWNTNSRDPKFGKIIVGEEGVQQYGFDDNTCMYAVNNNNNVKIFKVNTVSAALDNNYYVDLIN